jgi:microcin C transport system substrate-binding protein
VVMWNHWQVPELYFAAEPASFWNKFGMPRVRPKYYTIDNPNSAQLAWPILTWWIKPGAVKG